MYSCALPMGRPTGGGRWPSGLRRFCAHMTVHSAGPYSLCSVNGAPGGGLLWSFSPPVRITRSGDCKGTKQGGPRRAQSRELCSASKHGSQQSRLLRHTRLRAKPPRLGGTARPRVSAAMPSLSRWLSSTRQGPVRTGAVPDHEAGQGQALGVWERRSVASTPQRAQACMTSSRAEALKDIPRAQRTSCRQRSAPARSL